MGAAMNIARRGFTLIEMLVVILIATSALSLVGPRLFSSYEKIEIRAAEQRLTTVLNAFSWRAFARQESLYCRLAEEQLEVFAEPAKKPADEVAGETEPRLLYSRKFPLLYFESTEIVFNGNGFAETPVLLYQVGDEMRELQLEAVDGLGGSEYQ